MIPEVIDYAHGISAVDSGYQRPRLDAIHLIVEGDTVAVVDTGVNRSVPRILAALAAKNLQPAQVEYVMLTHIHLDHAGGAGMLMEACPNARLTVHPRGARHMADPAKLVAGTIPVYGEAVFRREYGEVRPIPVSRIIETPDGATVSMGRRSFRFLDTPGHARHHVAIVDGRSGHVFAGDTFGVSYRELDDPQGGDRQFIIPTTSPVHFEPAAAHRSVERILAEQPGAVYLTHYSQVRDLARCADALHRGIDAHAALARSVQNVPGGERQQRLLAGVHEIFFDELARYGGKLARDDAFSLYAMDLELNAQGLDSWLDAGMP
jgi:glyoxylase-like metal-dependent hydrolase (beta-lactamase superfamily II)